MFAVGHPSSSLPRPTGLNLSAATKPSVARVIARYVFLLICCFITQLKYSSVLEEALLFISLINRESS